MVLIPLEENNLSKEIKVDNIYIQLNQLIEELNKKEIPDSVIEKVNQQISEINQAIISNQKWKKVAKKRQYQIVKLIEKELKIAPKNHYRNMWLAIGIGGIGVPIGVAIGSGLGNLAFLGLGIPIGLAVGISVGTSMDKKAFEEGRQLDVEIKY